jgi:hypothetical protein
MTFHENFWLTVGAAAPVVALAAVVSFTDGIRVVESVNDLGRTAKVDWPAKNAGRSATVLASLFVISAANIILQVVALALALTALAQGHNRKHHGLLIHRRHDRWHVALCSSSPTLGSHVRPVGRAQVEHMVTIEHTAGNLRQVGIEVVESVLV